MNIGKMLSILLASTIVTTAGEASTGVVYVGHQKVSEALSRGGEAGNSGGPLVAAPDLHMRITGNHRSSPGEVEVHETETDTFYVVDGTATLVTGGTMAGSKISAPGQLRGTSILGGQTYHLSKGDVMVIPAGIPHWFKDIQSFSYYVVKVGTQNASYQYKNMPQPPTQP